MNKISNLVFGPLVGLDGRIFGLTAGVALVPGVGLCRCLGGVEIVQVGILRLYDHGGGMFGILSSDGILGKTPGHSPLKNLVYF